MDRPSTSVYSFYFLNHCLHLTSLFFSYHRKNPLGLGSVTMYSFVLSEPRTLRVFPSVCFTLVLRLRLLSRCNKNWSSENLGTLNSWYV